MAKNDKKSKGDKKGKKGKGAGEGVSVAGHPRAAAQVRRAKGFGGISLFFITAYLSHKAAVPPDQVALRALVGGIAGYMFAWAASVSIARHLVLAELRAAVESGRATIEPLKPQQKKGKKSKKGKDAGKGGGDAE
jgi:hypothetical protein